MEYRIYRQNIQIQSDGANEALVGEEVPVGYVLEITDMAIMDLTTQDKRCKLGYRDAADVDRWFRIATSYRPAMSDSRGGVFLMAGERPIGYVASAKEDDIIYFHCHGKLWPVK